MYWRRQRARYNVVARILPLYPPSQMYTFDVQIQGQSSRVKKKVPGQVDVGRLAFGDVRADGSQLLAPWPGESLSEKMVCDLCREDRVDATRGSGVLPSPAMVEQMIDLCWMKILRQGAVRKSDLGGFLRHKVGCT